MEASDKRCEMGRFLENAKKNREKERTEQRVRNSNGTGFLANTKAKRQQEKLNTQLNIITDTYNRSQKNLVGTDKYSSPAMHRANMDSAMMISKMGDMTKTYVSGLDASYDRKAINDYVDGIQSSIKDQNEYRDGLRAYMSQFKDEYDFGNYQKYSGKSQSEIDAKLTSLNQLIIGDVNNPNRESAIKERDWLQNYYNSNMDWLTGRNANDVKLQIDELDRQIADYTQKMNEASAMSGIQAMTYDENEYQQSEANKQKAADYQSLIESAQAQKEFLLSGSQKVNDYKAYIEAQNKYNELLSQGYKPSDSYGEALVYAAGSGAYDVLGKNTAAFTDAVLGEPMRRIENSKWGQKLGVDLPGEYIGGMYGAIKAQADINENFRHMDNFKYGGKGEQIGLNLSNVAGGMLPTILVSVLSGGTGAATGAKSVAGYLKQLAKSPTYWASVVNMGGSTYDSAIEEGASYEEALVSGLINGLVGAATETSGGFEKKLTNSNTFGNWLKSALEEGGEEVIQGVLENATKKAVYDRDRAVISTSDENAIINPSRMAQEFGYGALAGGLFSGGQILTSNVANTAYDVYAKNFEYDNIGKELEFNGRVADIIKEAEDFNVGSNVYKLAESVKAGLDKGNLDTTKLGKLYVEMNKAEMSANSAPVLAQSDEIESFDSNVSNSANSQENTLNGSISEDTLDGVVISSGEDIEINRMEIKGDKVSFVTTNNETLTQKEVALTDEMRTVVSFAKKYPQVTANTMLYAYKRYSEMPNAGGALMFSRSWNQMYQYGLTGSTTFDEAMEHVIKDIPRAIYESAYRMGQNDHKKEVEAKQKLADKKKTGIKAQGSVGSISEGDAKTYKVSTVDMDALSAKQKDAVAVMEVISKALGVNTYFFSDSGAGKIHGIYRDGNIYLNVNAGHFHEQAVLRTAAHELTHHIQNMSPKLYDDLKKFIMSKYHESNNKTFDALVQDKMNNLNLSMEKAIDEVIADACEMMLQDGSAVTELATKNKSLWENIKAFINTIVEKLKNAFKGVSESSAAAVELKNILGEWTELQKMWNEALTNSENHIVVNTGEAQFKKNRSAHYYKNIIPATREESKKLNMLDDRNIARYRNEIDGAFNGEMKEGTMILIGKPSEILLQHGVVNKPLFITQSVARKIAYPLEYKIGNKYMGGKHNLGMSALKNLPLQLCEPIAITKNTAKHSEDNSVVIWTNWIDRNNEGIMVAIRINKEGKIEISNTIATVFQAGEKYVNQFFENKDNILYTKNNEDIQKLLPFRRYVPEAKSDDVFIYRLLQENENVNSESDEYFSQELNSLSPRFILASTLMNATTSIEEQEHLTKYKDVIKSIEDKETKLSITRNAIRSAIYERDAGLEVSAESIAKMKQTAKNLERSIDYWDKKLLELEATTPLKNLMERQRKSLSEKYMNEARTRLDETRARFYASNRREQIKKNANTLITWLNRPDNNHYIPDVMKQPVVEFLSSIDFVSSKASPDSNTTKEWVAKMDKLKEMLTDLEANTKDYRAQEFMDAVDPELKDNIRSFLANNQNNAKLSDLSPVETEKLHRIIVALKSAVTNANKFYANRMSANVGQLGSRTIRDLHKYKNKSNNSLLSSVDGFFNADMLDAYSYFNMMGESGLSIYDELREGFDKRVFLLKEASEYMDSHLLSDKTAKERKKLLEEWTGSRAKVHEFKFKDYLGNDVSVKLTTGQLMNLYCLSRREQAMGHITVGGIRIKPAENKAVKGNVSGIHIGKSRLASWFSELTAEEKQTAEMMQRYLSATVSNWGNEVSQAMYGYDKFTEKNYWPIETDSNTNKSSDRTDGGTSLYQLKNMGITKAVTPRANNPLMVGDIFDVFSKHIGDMANYRGYVIPLMDAMKWYNYGNTFDIKDEEDSFTEFDSVKQQIERALGKDAKQYFIKLLQDINGGTPMDKTISEKFISSYKSASVGANLRVAIQQPTAYVRAAAVLDPKYLVKALGHKPAVKEMQEHSGVAQWKSYGYYDTGIGQSLKKIITGIDKPVENIRDKSMWLTGKADDITWGTIWNACKEEIKDTNPEAVDTEEFLKLVTKRFDEVIDRTQVVDTILHRTQIMRSKNAFNQMATSFMSEPSKSFNMLRNAIATMILNKDKASSLNAARTVSAWLISSVCTAAAASIVDAMRSAGDDEDKNAWERYVEAFKENAVDNINPLNMIPYLKEIPSIFEGYSPARMDMEALSSAVKFAKSITKLAKGENTKYNAYYYVRQLAKVGSQFSGLPVYNVMRDFEGIWNSVPATPKITTKKDTVSSLGKGIAAEYMAGNKTDAKAEQEKLENQIAKEYPSYSSDKVSQVAESKIKSGIASEYKEQYINGSASKRKEIMSAMNGTGLYDGYEEVQSICMNWEVSYWKDKYIKATSGAERAECRRKLYATGKWSSLDKLDADIKSWVSAK